MNPQEIILTPEELLYEEASENGTYIASATLAQDKKDLQLVAKNTLKRVPITFRPFEKDIRSLKAIALQEGVPYQTKLVSIVHQYLQGYRKSA